MEILVYADWLASSPPQLLGTLSFIRTKGRSVFSFTYEEHWIQAPQARQLDPDLQLFSGSQYLPEGKANFGMFLDSAPDRWGRVLMDRREAIIAKKEKRTPHKLFEENYLLGVYDEHRQGGLRFKMKEDGDFLDNDVQYAAPPWSTLRELESASYQLETTPENSEKILPWITMLIAPGASLGGARPKAGVQDSEGNLWIAKFPSINDNHDIGAWEYLTHQLAAASGITVHDAQLKKFGREHHTFLAKRFNRIGNTRRHFASAMTLLGLKDGEPGASYLDLVNFIQTEGARVEQDLEELYRRIVFSIAVKNTDDHLRNHGFLLSPEGWTLSPAYDVNPVVFGAGLSLNINEHDNSLNFDLVRSVAPYFRLSDARADSLIAEILVQRKQWRKMAENLHIPRQEQERMAGAFEAE